MIVRDEQHLARRDDLSSSTQRTNAAAGGGILRGVERACRECAEHGTKIARGEALVLQDLAADLESRAVAARFPERSRDEASSNGPAAGGKRRAITRRPICEESGRNCRTCSRRNSLPKERIASLGPSRISPGNVGSCCNRFSSRSSSASPAKGSRNNSGGCFAESAVWLRLPAGVAAAGGIATVLAAMISASVADVTGVMAVSAAALGTFFAFGQRRKILECLREGDGDPSAKS